MAASIGKRDALERSRRWSRGRAVILAFVVGGVVGGTIAHAFAVWSTSPLPTDSEAPSVLAVVPTEGAFLTAGDATFRITFTEPLSRMPGVAFVGPENLTFEETSLAGTAWIGHLAIGPSSDGAYVLVVSGLEDERGNRGRETTFPYLVDTMPPIARAFTASNATSVPFDVTWDSSDGNGSGVARVELWYRENAQAWALLTTTSEDTGTYRFDPGGRNATFGITAVAIDRAGNRQVRAEPQAIVAYDPSPPSAALRPPSGYWFRSSVSLSAVATANTTAADLRFYFSADNATWQGPFGAGNATSLSWTFAFPLGGGHYRLYASGIDAQGSWERDQTPAAAEVACGYDDEVPTSRLAPAPVYWHAGPLAVAANASDDRSGLARLDLAYTYRQNGSVGWSPWTTSASRANLPWTFTFDFPEGDGRYELTTRAVDNAGWEESLPVPGQAELPLGFDRVPPSPPGLSLPAFVDAANGTANLTWRAIAAADLAGFEIHRGGVPDFGIDAAPCATSTTCILAVDPRTRTAWAPLPTANATFWFRVRALDEGGLAAASASVGANVHGLGYDTPNSFATAANLPIGIAWSERLQYSNGCVDCADVFKIVVAAGERLRATLAVPATGDFRIVLYNAAIQVVARGETPGLGVWETLSFDVAVSGTYFLVADWGNVFGPGNQNLGWYTLSVTLA